MKIYHYNRSKTPSFSDLKISTLHSKSKGYKNLTRKLLKRNRVVLKMVVEGTSCWQVYSNIFFAGEKQDLDVGFKGEPEFAIKSAKSQNCNLFIHTSFLFENLEIENYFYFFEHCNYLL